jgi:hypothetical protein
MSKSSGRRRRLKRQHVPKPKVAKPMSDQAIYLGLAIVGLFVGILAWLFNQQYWMAIVLLYVLAVVYLINFYTFQVYRGKHLEHWKQALARVPLRFVGYGTKEGKPLEAAHDHPETRTALLASIALSAAIVAGLSLVIVRVVIDRL